MMMMNDATNIPEEYSCKIWRKNAAGRVKKLLRLKRYFDEYLIRFWYQVLPLLPPPSTPPTPSPPPPPPLPHYLFYFPWFVKKKVLDAIDNNYNKKIFFFFPKPGEKPCVDFRCIKYVYNFGTRLNSFYCWINDKNNNNNNGDGNGDEKKFFDNAPPPPPSPFGKVKRKKITMGGNLK